MKSKGSVLILILTISVLFTRAQVPEIYNFQEFEPFLNNQNDTTYVINFWATWCIPCVKELPDFEKLNSEFKNDKFRMILVSLDFKSQLNTSLLPFIKKNRIESEVILLSDPNSNEWINRVNKKWTGSIPATIIFNRDFYFFHEGSMNYSQLYELITQNIKQ